MNKRIIVLSIFVFAFLNFGINKIEAATDAALFFDQTSVSVSADQKFTLVAKVNPGTNEVGAVELDINFDKNILRLDSIEKSDSFNMILSGPKADNEKGTGFIDVGLLSSPATYITTTSDVAVFAFTALASTKNSLISFANTSNVSSHGEFVLASKTGAQVKINSINSGDSVSPVISEFSIPAESSSLKVPISAFIASDNNRVVGYMITESADTPLAGDLDWMKNAPTEYVFSTGGSKTLYAWTKDEAGNISDGFSKDIKITAEKETIQESEVVISNGVPFGKLSSDTTGTNLSVITDKEAVCRFSTNVDISYDLMSETFSSTGETVHSSPVDGLFSGEKYKYYVKCKDSAGNINAKDYIISFSVKNKDLPKNEEVKIQRKIINSQSKISRGQVLVQKGKRFSLNGDVLLYFSKDGEGYGTSSSGKFIVSYRVDKPSGKYNWYALDVKTGKKSNINSYMIK